MDQYVQEYLRVIQQTVDNQATLDKRGNVVYVEQQSGNIGIKVITVSPDECRQEINTLYGGWESE